MRVLVTGANGFIGSHLVRKLVTDGFEVQGLVHESQERLNGLKVNLFQGSVTRPETLVKPLEGVEIVFHLAARASDWGSRETFFRVNTVGTRHLLEAAQKAGCRRFVFLSSLAVHRFVGHKDADETTPADQARYPYGASKLAAEHLVQEAHAHGQIEGTIVRPGVVVFGPEDTTSFVHMAPLLKSGRWTHVRGGRPLLCYSHVTNLVHGLVLAGTHQKAAGEVFIITDGIRITWKKLISQIIKSFGVEEKSLSFAKPVARTAGITLEGLYRMLGRKNPPPVTDYRTALVSEDFHFTNQKAQRLLGYTPIVPFEKGIRQTVDWYLSRKETR